MIRRLPTLATALIASGLLAGSAAGTADAASTITVRGAGFGHGVGMSQYGAYGFALHGASYQQILAHYYSGTGIGSVPANTPVRVLLQSTGGDASFTGAAKAGDRALNPAATYRVRRHGATEVDLLSSSGRRVGTYAAPLQVLGTDAVQLRGKAGNGVVNGRYRGLLEFRPGRLSGVNSINAVNMEDYLRGVVAAESPASWPQEALRAQAIAARSYALTTSKDGDGFDQYPDTRSQVYRGVAGEVASSDAAVAATAGQVVTYQGTPVTTFFFSTSGGRTENNETSAIGGTPKPWLRSVEDPYDDVSPRHVWAPVRMSTAQARAKLGSLVKGSLRGIKVIARGASPRVQKAQIIGTRGTTTVSGADLRWKLGLPDTWAYFTTISTTKKKPATPVAQRTADHGGTGGLQADAAAAIGGRTVGTLTGRITPAQAGDTLVVQRRSARGGWYDLTRSTVGSGGTYRADVRTAGTFRVKAGSALGPVVRIR